MLVSVALCSVSSVVAAADLPARVYTKAPAVVPAITNWTGLYIGAFGGYGWGKASANDVDLDPSDGADATSIKPKGGFGGGTIGYNWQTPGSAVVWGLEADLAGGEVKVSELLDDGAMGRYQVDLFGSVTGRVGYAFNDVLVYAKGGYGWADAKLSVADAIDGFSSSKTHSGYTVGGGIEYLFAPSWSAKVEYLYAEYGAATYGPSPDGDTGSIKLTANSIKAGINYHFR